MERKYRLTDETLRFKGRMLHRIVAVRDFSDVKKGDLGGFVGGESNLNHEGDCWIYGNAKAYDRSRVFDDAKMYDESEAYGYSWVYDDAKMYKNAKIFENAGLWGAAVLGRDSEVSGYSEVVF